MNPSEQAPDAAQPVFYLDLADPWSYLAAERVMTTLAEIPEWEPVHGADLGLPADPEPAQEAIAERIAQLGLQPLRWPARWPPGGRRMALTATYAKRGGRAVCFAQAAMRQTFAGGRDPDEESTVLLAAAACEMHPTAVLKGIALRGTAEALERAARRATADGVTALPALAAGGRVWSGPDALAEAAAVIGPAVSAHRR